MKDSLSFTTNSSRNNQLDSDLVSHLSCVCLVSEAFLGDTYAFVLGKFILPRTLSFPVLSEAGPKWQYRESTMNLYVCPHGESGTSVAKNNFSKKATF